MNRDDRWRVSHVHFAWPLYAWEDGGRRRWDVWDVGRTSLTVGAAAWGAAVYLETGLWFAGRDPYVGLMSRRPLGWVLLLALVALNGWVLDLVLARRSPGERTFRPGVRAARAAIVALPIVGLAALPTWRWLLAARPHWSQRSIALPGLDLGRGAYPPGNGLARRLESWHRHAAQSFLWLALWVVLCEVGPALLLVSWMGARRGWGTGRSSLALACCIGCHLVTATAAGVQMSHEIHRLQVTGWRRRAFFTLPILLLLPFPASVLGLLSWLPISGETREENTLVYDAFDRRGKASRSLAWSTLPSSLSSMARRFGRMKDESHAFVFGRSPDLGVHEARRRSFYRLKTFLLGLDAAALGWWLSHIAHRPVVSMQSPPSALAPFLVAMALGLLLNAVALVSRLARFQCWGELWERYPFGRYLAWTQLAFAVGLLAGSLVAAGQASWLGLLLTAVGFAGCFAVFLFAAFAGAVHMAGRSPVLSALWILLFFEIAVGAQLLQSNPEAAGAVLTKLRWALALVPLWSLGLGWALGWKLGSPAATTNKLRAFLTATAFLPLGGLAIPLWIYVGRHGTERAR
jgi:hypothetical protein